MGRQCGERRHQRHHAKRRILLGSLCRGRRRNRRAGRWRTTGGRLPERTSPTSTYIRFIREDAFDLASGGSAHDPWHRLGGGFRLDWTPSAQDLVTLQGDIFKGREDQGVGAWEDASGHDLASPLEPRHEPGRNLQVQAYYDRAHRATEPHQGRFFVDTYDLDLQDSLPLGGHNQLVLGGGARIFAHHIGGVSHLLLRSRGPATCSSPMPSSRTPSTSRAPSA